jgi:hypothetical protein
MFVRVRGFEAVVVLSVLTLLQSCSCGKSPLKPSNQCAGITGVQADHTDSCATSDECGQHFTCNPVKDQTGLLCCTFADRACATEADCCEGQTCPADRKKCFDKYISCEKDSDCGDTGDSFCQVYSDNYGTSSRCRLNPCGALGACPDGQACFQGECIAALPCGGTCPSGQACVPSINRCQDYSSPTGRTTAACPMTCLPGYIGTFKDPRNLWDSCDLAAVQCVCAELPPIHSADLGRFSAIAADPGAALYVSQYDGDYGDLVVTKFGLDGKKIATEYVDGVPQGTVTYGPSGPRGGVIDPGPDVGRYTDVAVSAGRVYVSYYDVTNGDLKFALRGTDGKWATHTVDGATADVGRYSSIAIDADGHPGISYFQSGAGATFQVSDCPGTAPTGPTKYISALKFARATTATPAKAADWSVKTLACQSRTPPVCDACTGVCAVPVIAGSSPLPGCFAATTGCTACDANKQACISVSGTPTCGTKYLPPDLQQIFEGIGVFSSLAFKDDDAIIAFMRRNPATATTAVEGDLLGVTVSSTGAAGTPVVLDSTGDTGYFPDVKIEPGTKKIAIGYQDFTAKALKFYYSANLQAGVTAELVDTGVDPAMAGNQSFVGADTAIVFGPPGQIWALYQDATKGDLKLAKRATTWTVQPPVSSAGAVGFFADGVFTDGKVYASHAKVHSRLFQGAPKVDNSLLLETLTP